MARKTSCIARCLPVISGRGEPAQHRAPGQSCFALCGQRAANSAKNGAPPPPSSTIEGLGQVFECAALVRGQPRCESECAVMMMTGSFGNCCTKYSPAIQTAGGRACGKIADSGHRVAGRWQPCQERCRHCRSKEPAPPCLPVAMPFSSTQRIIGSSSTIQSFQLGS